jgi:hypothetical protein
MATVRVEGVEFQLDEAREFVRRAKLYQRGTSEGGLSPGNTLAVQIEKAVDEGGGPVEPLTDEEKLAASAVADEWQQNRDAPAAVRNLRRIFGS